MNSESLVIENKNNFGASEIKRFDTISSVISGNYDTHQVQKEIENIDEYLDELPN